MDLADGHVKALEFLNQNYPSILNVNLGTGKGTSVLELIKTFEIMNNVKINFNFDERRAGDLCEVVADNKLANKLFRWKRKQRRRQPGTSHQAFKGTKGSKRINKHIKVTFR